MFFSSDNDVDSVAVCWNPAKTLSHPTSARAADRVERQSGTTTTPLLVRQRKDSRWSPRKQEKLLLRLLLPNTSSLFSYVRWFKIISYRNMHVFGCLIIQIFKISYHCTYLRNKLKHIDMEGKSRLILWKSKSRPGGHHCLGVESHVRHHLTKKKFTFFSFSLKVWEIPWLFARGMRSTLQAWSHREGQGAHNRYQGQCQSWRRI